jgi:ribose transport system substrate-binding protein
MLLALQDMKKAGSVRFVGFDASPIIVEAMRAKQLDGIAVQNPMKMGRLGVISMVDHLRGRPVERRIDTGVVLVTPENLDTPESKDILNPPIAKYLTGG